MASVLNPPWGTSGFAWRSAMSRARALRPYNTLLSRGVPASQPCSSCQSRGSVCIGMPGKRLKCAECTRRGRKCVDAVWHTGLLNRRRLEQEFSGAQRDAATAQRQAAASLARAERLWAALEALNRRAEAEAECLAKEIEEEESRGVEISPPTSSQLVSVVAPASEFCGMFDDGLFNSTSLDPIADFDALVGTLGVSGGTISGD